MFNYINNNKDISKILEGLTKDAFINIIQSGPLLGILILECFLKRGGKTPVPSIVGSKVITTNFYHWNNINEHVNMFLENEEATRKISDIQDFKKNIINISKNETILYCYTVALFMEFQMEVFSLSPYPVQEIVKELIQPLFDGKEIYQDYDSPSMYEASNTLIYITLHAGNKPFVQVNYPNLTIQYWQNELEAAVALSIPQLLDLSIRNLEIPEKLLLKEMIHNVYLSWKDKFPRIGEPSDWSWLPLLMN